MHTKLRLKEENRSLLSYKSTLVHEINHAVTHIFNTYDFNCDELRSYLMQDIYFDFIDYIDTLNDKGLLWVFIQVKIIVIML